MSNYRLLYRLRIEHDYFVRALHPIVQLKVVASTADLMKRRGLIFKQTDINEWCVISCNSNAEIDIQPDVFILEMSISDPAFFHYTEWASFDPSSLYYLSLPTIETDVTKAIKKEKKREKEKENEGIEKNEKKRRINSGFCTIDLHFSKAILEGDPITNTLMFHSKELYWEYFFIARNEEYLNEKEIVLKEAKGEVAFSNFNVTEIYGHKALCFRSESKLKLADIYNLHFSLLELSPNSSNTRKVLIRSVAHPVVGRFIAKRTDTLLNICYF